MTNDTTKRTKLASAIRLVSAITPTDPAVDSAVLPSGIAQDSFSPLLTLKKRDAEQKLPKPVKQVVRQSSDLFQVERRHLHVERNDTDQHVVVSVSREDESIYRRMPAINVFTFLKKIKPPKRGQDAVFKSDNKDE